MWEFKLEAASLDNFFFDDKGNGTMWTRNGEELLINTGRIIRCQ